MPALLATVLRIAIGFVFIGAGLGKLTSGGAFVHTLRALGLTSEAWGIFVARWMAYAELGVGALLIVGVGLPWANYAAAGLFALFATTIGARLLHGPIDATCNCFGRHLAAKVTWHLVFRNLGCAALAIMSSTGLQAGLASVAVLGLVAGVSLKK